MQIAYQNRTLLSNAESRKSFGRFRTELLKGSKLSESRVSTAELSSNHWDDGGLIALESAQGNECRPAIFGNCIASARYEGTAWRRQKVPARLRCGTRLFDQKECPMEFKGHDFIRNPVVQNQVFFLESKCAGCGFSVLTRSIEELIEHEKLHRTQCSPSHAAA
jgi:hypothetical protein